jgi:hypothetical protein
LDEEDPAAEGDEDEDDDDDDDRDFEDDGCVLSSTSPITESPLSRFTPAPEERVGSKSIVASTSSRVSLSSSMDPVPVTRFIRRSPPARILARRNAARSGADNARTNLGGAATEDGSVLAGEDSRDGSSMAEEARNSRYYF